MCRCADARTVAIPKSVELIFKAGFFSGGIMVFA